MKSDMYENNMDDNQFSSEDFIEKYDESRDFITLECWKQANDLKLYLYNSLIQLLPIDEKYNLSIQIRRAAVSVTANIAEGYGRFNFKEAVQFYRIARASLYELKDHMISCHLLQFISVDMYTYCISLIEKAKTTLNGFIRFNLNQINKAR